MEDCSIPQVKISSYKYKQNGSSKIIQNTFLFDGPVTYVKALSKFVEVLSRDVWIKWNWVTILNGFIEKKSQIIVKHLGDSSSPLKNRCFEFNHY
ncbi:hypothetical protein HanXRQr2_Chr09g0386391 [Helianthus annuus]|uniref:Uncharacterized protein n=1 Tax=Helianthus annuus TaxID=4232 RepID=A0A251TUY4_HELAN|nr:hypothetical protein HanXRQr2_Chr09g0386391 [Helianthus annuus]KAJ0892979.1 hypothetical protein HanPSC8_Chr09g0372371 [Helianthus annuus]